MKICKGLFVLLFVVNIQGIFLYNSPPLYASLQKSLNIPLFYSSISNKLVSLVSSSIPVTVGSMIPLVIFKANAINMITSSITSSSGAIFFITSSMFPTMVSSLVTTSTSIPSSTLISTSTPSSISTSTSAPSSILISTSTPTSISTSTTSTTTSTSISTSTISTSSVVTSTTLTSSSVSSSSSVSVSSSASEIDCPPNPSCTTNTGECYCNNIISDSNCNDPKYQPIEYIINTYNQFYNEYNNFTNQNTQDFIEKVNLYVVQLLGDNYNSICSQINTIMNGSTILNITIYIDFTNYDPIITENYISKKLLTPNSNYPLNVTSIIGVPNLCIQNFSYPISTASSTTKCGCLSRPNTEKLFSGCTVFYRFYQKWTVELNNTDSNQSYIIQPNNSSNDITTLLDSANDMITILSLQFPSLIMVNSSLIGPNLIYAEYKFSDLSELIINSWQSLVENGENLTTLANFSFGTNITLSLTPNTPLKDVNECETNNTCHKNATCINSFGSYDCVCNPNYIGNGTYCTKYDLTDNFCKNSENPVWAVNKLFCIKSNSVNYYRYRRAMIAMSVIGALSLIILTILVVVVGIH